MRTQNQHAVLAAAIVAIVLAFGVGVVLAQDKCLAGKTKCVAKKMAGLLKCHEKAEKRGAEVDSACLDKARDKFDGGTKGSTGSCFGKLEIKHMESCVNLWDFAAQGSKIDAFVIDVVQEVDPGYPAPLRNSCSAGKKKCVSKKTEGLLKCRAKCQKDPAQCGPVQTDCETKVRAKFDGGTRGPDAGCIGRLEAKQNGSVPETACPTTGDVAALEVKVDAFVADVLTELETARFVDNGDGTITDTRTGLQWEKKVDFDGTENLADPHDADNTYTWSSTGSAPDGTAFTQFLAALNTGPCFAGHCDWQLPTVNRSGDPAELETIVYPLAPGCAFGNPCIYPIFGPTAAEMYWSSTTESTLPDLAYVVHFYIGSMSLAPKASDYHARAVRGGS